MPRLMMLRRRAMPMLPRCYFDKMFHCYAISIDAATIFAAVLRYAATIRLLFHTLRRHYADIIFAATPPAYRLRC